MRRHKNLFRQVSERENLLLACHKAMKGKRDQSEVRAFAANFDAELAALQRELSDRSVGFGNYHQFVIWDPKRRVITAPCFRERVIHHAIINVCEPVFDRWLISDTYACRQGRGRLAALDRARSFAGRFEWFLKMDVRKYFESISHKELLVRLRRLFGDSELVALFESVIGSFQAATGKGLPIGALTSQHFANFYLGWFDRWVKETKRCVGYVRYMDDMAIWGRSSRELMEMLSASGSFLREELDLTIKDFPGTNRTALGMSFLGCRVFPRHLLLNRTSKVRYRRKLRYLDRAYRIGLVTEEDYQRRVTALTAFTKTRGVKSWQFRQSVLRSSWVDGHGLEPRESRR